MVSGKRKEGNSIAVFGPFGLLGPSRDPAFDGTREQASNLPDRTIYGHPQFWWIVGFQNLRNLPNLPNLPEPPTSPEPQ